MGCKMTKSKKQRKKPIERDEPSTDLGEIDIMTLDRKQLQKLCKELGLKANGKTAELQEKLKSFKFDDLNNNKTVENQDCLKEFDDQQAAVCDGDMSTMREQVSKREEEEYVDQIIRKTRPQKPTKTTKSKKQGKKVVTSTEEIKDDEKQENKRERGKGKTDKKSMRNITSKDVVREYTTTRREESLLDDDSFVIEKICRYDDEDVSKDDMNHDHNNNIENERTRKSARNRSKQNDNLHQARKVNEALRNGECKPKQPKKTKPTANENENQPDSFEEDGLDENSKRIKVVESKKYSRKKKEKKVEEETELEDKSKKDPEVNILSKKTKTKEKVGKTQNFESKRLGELNEKEQLQFDINGEDYSSDKAQSESLVLDVTGQTNDAESFVRDDLKEIEIEDKSKKVSEVTILLKKTKTKEKRIEKTQNFESKKLDEVKETVQLQYDVNAEDIDEAQSKSLVLDVTGQTNDAESFVRDDLQEKEELKYETFELVLQDDMSLRDLSSNSNCHDETDYSSVDKERDSTFTISVNEQEQYASARDSHQTKETELEKQSVDGVERGSSVSSAEDEGMKRNANRFSTTDDQEVSNRPQSLTCCTRWCVVDGILKNDSEVSWKRIKLKGGRPIVPNRFGKYIPFVLEPSHLDVPGDFRDNYICGSCVRDNEGLYSDHCKAPDKTASKQLQDLTSSTCKAAQKEDNENTETPLNTFTRDGIRASVKRKRVEGHSSMTENQQEPECQTLLSKRRRSSLTSSQQGIPASPVVRKARGENLKLPRDHNKPWRPKKTSRSSSPSLVIEDASFAQKVEAIIKNTVPGSEEELNLIMSRNSRVKRSPTKT